MQCIEGKIVDVVNRNIYEGHIYIDHGKIIKIIECKTTSKVFILPGLIDSHIHIESSLLIPSEFAKIAVKHGTVATISDPHEIANVLGIDGVQFMIDNGKKVPFKFFFGAPSCVPATSFETSGAILNANDTDKLLENQDIYFLGEMMNYPGVINKDNEVMNKIVAAHKHNKKIDGHAPGVSGLDLKKYSDAGISTDHECINMMEAVEKINYGMSILIREGSAAKNFENLCDIIDIHPEKVMFCSDDKHPDELNEGHINILIKEAIKNGYDIYNVLRCATLNPIKHYNIPVGLLQLNDDADLIIIDNFDDFNVLATYIKGEKVAENGVSLINSIEEKAINNFNCNPIEVSDLQVQALTEYIKIIEIIPDQLITKKTYLQPKISDGMITIDKERDILKLVVYNRYNQSKPVIGFIKNFGLKKGALASTIAHDSHNIIAVGCSDEEIVKAINTLVVEKGGLIAVDGDIISKLSLNVAGLMSNKTSEEVIKDYKELKNFTTTLGSPLSTPFMTLSFLSLLVIPELKLSDKGLFDVNFFDFTSIYN